MEPSRNYHSSAAQWEYLSQQEEHPSLPRFPTIFIQLCAHKVHLWPLYCAYVELHDPFFVRLRDNYEASPSTALPPPPISPEVVRFIVTLAQYDALVPCFREIIIMHWSTQEMPTQKACITKKNQLGRTRADKNVINPSPSCD